MMLPVNNGDNKTSKTIRKKYFIDLHSRHDIPVIHQLKKEYQSALFNARKDSRSSTIDRFYSSIFSLVSFSALKRIASCNSFRREFKISNLS